MVNFRDEIRKGGRERRTVCDRRKGMDNTARVAVVRRKGLSLIFESIFVGWFNFWRGFFSLLELKQFEFRDESLDNSKV